MENVSAQCPIHGIPMEEKTGQYGSFWSHRTAEGFCDGKKIKPFKNPGFQPASAAALPIAREPIGQGKAEQEKAMWEAKDRQSLAQTAMKSASEVVAALINAKALVLNNLNDITPIEDIVKKTANQFYIELKAMKSEE